MLCMFSTKCHVPCRRCRCDQHHWGCFLLCNIAERIIRLRLREVAQQKDMSQRQLSLRSGVDINTVRKIFQRPTSILTTETLDKFAKVLQVVASELIESILGELS